MTRILYALALVPLLYSCSPRSNDHDDTIKSGIWRATLNIQGKELPFNFEVSGDSSRGIKILLRNADERILLDDISFRNDSIFAPLHIFDASIQAKIEGDRLHGNFIKHYEKDSAIPFSAEYGNTSRFEVPETNNVNVDFNGRYTVRFFGKDTTNAVGIFNQKNDSVTGTFLTATGDYRYLQGNVINDTIHLSAFDGNHVYLFEATKSTDSISGIFYSGKTSKKPWKGIKNDGTSLPSATSITYLKPGYDKIEFSFPDINGKTISLNDPKYQNKVIILQLMGTWCPNCMDETNFLVPWYNQNKDRGVEIIALAYERKDDFAYASERVKKMIDKLDVTYDVVIAGTNDKVKASQSLPMLNQLVAWPTTIYIGKDGKVKKIYTGFSGPGTGTEYDRFKEEFNETINQLLTEKPTDSKITKSIQ
jgi:thiol-disulfide isomerase/thioredoxin